VKQQEYRHGSSLLYASIGLAYIRIGTVRYNWPMSAHASQVFSISHCTDSEDLPFDIVCYSVHKHSEFLGSFVN